MARVMVRSWSRGSPRTINPPTAPQPKPSTESSIPVRPKTRFSINCSPSSLSQQYPTGVSVTYHRKSLGLTVPSLTERPARVRLAHFISDAGPRQLHELGERRV